MLIIKLIVAKVSASPDMDCGKVGLTSLCETLTCQVQFLLWQIRTTICHTPNNVSLEGSSSSVLAMDTRLLLLFQRTSASAGELVHSYDITRLLYGLLHLPDIILTLPTQNIETNIGFELLLIR